MKRFLCTVKTTTVRVVAILSDDAPDQDDVAASVVEYDPPELELNGYETDDTTEDECQHEEQFHEVESIEQDVSYDESSATA